MFGMGGGTSLAPEVLRGPETLAAWALEAPDDEAQGLRAVLALADAPVGPPARAAARLISTHHRVETVRRLAARVAATLVQVR
ncbi:hypothetical protein [Elioraea sp.]|uniref:hypothetical protein n=1 Tax=Elioraea sp. TaxID=2185103 RepID=UPI0025C5890E|nr:hypothetical protein [Elioraea sp.]